MFEIDTSPDSIFKRDRDFIQIILIKEKIQQTYKNHIKQSTVINNVYERLRNKDFIDPSCIIECENLALEGNASTVIEFTQWMTKFSHSLNKLFNMNLNDLTKMIDMAHFLAFSIHTTIFYLSNNNDWRFIWTNKVSFSKNVYLKLFGYHIINLLFMVHSKLKSLDLTENELALLYAFVLFSCECKFYVFNFFSFLNFIF